MRVPPPTARTHPRRLAESAATERPASVAPVRSSRVHDQIDPTVHGSRLLENLLHARPIGDVALDSNGTGERHTIKRRLGTGDAHDGPPLSRQKLDHRATKVSRAEDDRAAPR